MLTFKVALVLLATPILASPALLPRQCVDTCGSTCYYQSDIDEAVAQGCRYYRNGQKVGSGGYPHTYNDYEGFDFPDSGPYQEFPILSSYNAYTGASPGADRVIFTNSGQTPPSMWCNIDLPSNKLSCSGLPPLKCTNSLLTEIIPMRLLSQKQWTQFNLLLLLLPFRPIRILNFVLHTSPPRLPASITPTIPPTPRRTLPISRPRIPKSVRHPRPNPSRGPQLIKPSPPDIPSVALGIHPQELPPRVFPSSYVSASSSALGGEDEGVRFGEVADAGLHAGSCLSTRVTQASLLRFLHILVASEVADAEDSRSKFYEGVVNSILAGVGNGLRSMVLRILVAYGIVHERDVRYQWYRQYLQAQNIDLTLHVANLLLGKTKFDLDGQVLELFMMQSVSADKDSGTSVNAYNPTVLPIHGSGIAWA
ncbi:hypothetical protein G7Y79_00032g067680 [Physcia stellaris]|nr:hypothetical protein G7Y79_00032g067680 [Physcia stellaris]